MSLVPQTPSNVQCWTPTDSQLSIASLTGGGSAGLYLASGAPPQSFQQIQASQVANTPTNPLSSTNLQAAINEIETTKLFNTAIDINSATSISIPNDAWTAVTTTGATLFNNPQPTPVFTSGAPSFTITDATGFSSNAQHLISARCTFASNPTNLRGIRVLINGSVAATTLSPADPHQPTQLSVFTPITGQNGNVYTLQVYQNSGGALDIADVIGGYNSSTDLRMFFLGHYPLP